MQISTQPFRANDSTNDLVHAVIARPDDYQFLLTEITQTHLMPFDQLQQFYRLGQDGLFSQCHSTIRWTIAHAIQMLEARLRSLHKLGELVESASSNEALEEALISVPRAEFEVLES